MRLPPSPPPSCLPCSPLICEANSSTMRENFDALLALGKALLPAAGCAPVPRTRQLSRVTAPTLVPSWCGSRWFPVAQLGPILRRCSHRQTGAGAAGGGAVCRGTAGGRRGTGLCRLRWVPGLWASAHPPPGSAWGRGSARHSALPCVPQRGCWYPRRRCCRRAMPMVAVQRVPRKGRSSAAQVRGCVGTRHAVADELVAVTAAWHPRWCRLSLVWDTPAALCAHRGLAGTEGEGRGRG